MQKYNIGKYHVEIDKEATANWYEKSSGWNCECEHCRNFLKLARMKALPAHIMGILNELGILPEKATYVCKLYTDDAGIHYQFSYRIAGLIIDTPGDHDAENGENGRCWHESYPYGAPNFPEPNFDLEFDAILPWILKEDKG